MINILIVTHGNFGRELLNSAEMIIGKIEDVEVISFQKSDSYDELCDTVEKTINRLSENNDLIVFTDMYGGSPFNAVTKLMKKNSFFHVTGINFPLFMDIALSRISYTMEEISDKVIKNGKKSIVFVNDRFTFD